MKIFHPNFTPKRSTISFINFSQKNIISIIYIFLHMQWRGKKGGIKIKGVGRRWEKSRKYLGVNKSEDRKKKGKELIKI